MRDAERENLVQLYKLSAEGLPGHGKVEVRASHLLEILGRLQTAEETVRTMKVEAAERRTREMLIKDI